MYQLLHRFHIPIGLRTLKTALAVTLALLVVEQYGASTAKMIFAVVGAIAAMEPTIKSALRNSVAQIVGVIFGVVLAGIMRQLPIPAAVAVGVGIVLIMMFFQLFHWHQSPVLACLVLVTICTDPTVVAHVYGLARIWDTAIGLAIGMAVNMLILPYDNSKKIRTLVSGLNGDLILFLEDMFDGDEHLPETREMQKRIDNLQTQLALFEDQRLFRRRRQKVLLKGLRRCEDTARELMVEVQTLRNMDHVGRLNQENRAMLRALGAKIPEKVPEGESAPADIVANYHVAKLLLLREQLKGELAETRRKKRK